MIAKAMDFKDLLGKWEHYATYDVDMEMTYRAAHDGTSSAPPIWHFVSETELIISNQNGTQPTVRYFFSPARLVIVLVYPKQFLTASSEAHYSEQYIAHLINPDTLLLFSDDLTLHLKRARTVV